MNFTTVTCLSLGSIFCIFGLLFYVLKGKGAMLIGGFNTLPKEEREYYDKERMSRDQGNSFMLWGGVLGAGALASHFISSYAAAVALILWLILFFREVHWDTEKAFGKYRK